MNDIAFLNWLSNLEKVFNVAAVIVIDKDASVVPIVLSSIAHFELYECGLAGLNGRVILCLWDTQLIRIMFNYGQVFNAVSFILFFEYSPHPLAPAFVINLRYFSML